MLVSLLSRARRFVRRLHDSFRNLLERPHPFIGACFWIETVRRAAAPVFLDTQELEGGGGVWSGGRVQRGRRNRSLWMGRCPPGEIPCTS